MPNPKIYQGQKLNAMSHFVDRPLEKLFHIKVKV